MKTLHRTLPNFTLEDELAILRGIAGVALASVIAMLGLELAIRLLWPESWPTLANFSMLYNLTLTEFALITGALTALLVKRDWYEQVPRESILRLRWLLIAVFLWLGLHYFAVFHTLGSLHGPLMPLFPVLIVLVFVLFPGTGGWLAATYLVAGHMTVLLLEHCNIIINPGQLMTDHPPTNLNPRDLVSLGITVVIAVSLGRLIRKRFDETGSALYHKSHLDSFSGLYNAEFLKQRLQSELNRARRQHFKCSLIALELTGMEACLSGARKSKLHEIVQQVGACILDCTRITMDTSASSEHSPVSFTVLLPNTDAEQAQVVCSRLNESLLNVRTSSGTGPEPRIAIVEINNAENVTVDKVLDIASATLDDMTDNLKIVQLPKK